MRESDKQKARLERRQKSHDATMARLKPSDRDGYKRPGSMNRKKAWPKGTR